MHETPLFEDGFISDSELGRSNVLTFLNAPAAAGLLGRPGTVEGSHWTSRATCLHVRTVAFSLLLGGFS